MGLFDDLMGDVVGSVLGGGSRQTANNPLGGLIAGLAGGNQARGGNLLGAAMALVQELGGLPALLELLRNGGLARHAESWVGTGANVGISGEQVRQVLGGPALQGFANRLGASPSEASSLLAQILPELVNQLTPQGQVPDDHQDLLSQGLSMLRRGVS